MQHVVVRNAEPSDAKTVAAMIEEIERHYGATSIQPFEERLAQVEAALFGTPPLAYCVLAVIDGEVIGLAAYSFLWPAAGSAHSLFLKELYVQPDGRRLGTGTRLMREMQAIAAARPGCSRVEWMTDRDNDDARAFYRRLGFEEFAGKVNYRVASAVSDPLA
ncbi:N-acetyltransferase family protein [Dactylosporangium sp. CA-233914]|uniref:GNAT family N-acetyltransferase n=1 Tax=Dactylosporangium sp. CA-233914 TaxID=3239934 RepID=UPI003D925F04